MVLWSSDRVGAGSLPTYVGHYRQFRRELSAETASGPGQESARVRVVARITHAGELSARADIAFLDGNGALVAVLNDYECVIDASLNQAFRRNQLAGAPR